MFPKLLELIDNIISETLSMLYHALREAKSSAFWQTNKTFSDLPIYLPGCLGETGTEMLKMTRTSTHIHVHPSIYPFFLLQLLTQLFLTPGFQSLSLLLSL